MALAKEDIEYIKRHMGEWLAEASLGKPPAVYELEPLRALEAAAAVAYSPV